MNQVASAQPFPPTAGPGAGAGAAGLGAFINPQSSQQYSNSGSRYGAAAPSPNNYASQQASAPPQQHAGSQQHEYHGGSYQPPIASMPPMNNTLPPHFVNQQQHHPYTTGPYSQSLPAQAPPAPTSALPHLQHQFPPPSVRQSPTASPHPRQSPNAAFRQLPQQQPQPSQQTPPNKYPMAAPPLLQSPANARQATGSSTAHSPGTPQSPGSQSREQQRVVHLLDINMELLQEVHNLQAQGKGGAISAQQLAQMKGEGKQAEMASDDYVQVLRRVQANLAYLMPKAQNDSSKVPQGPAHMTPPPHMPHLQPKYDQLSELFTGWQGYDRGPSGTTSLSPQPNGGMGAVPTPAERTPPY